MTDSPITRSPDVPILSSLHSALLAAIHVHGPQSVMSLWQQTKCQPLAAVFVAIGELADSGYIEKSYANASYWQLTEKGRQRIAPAGEQEVPCTNHHRQMF
jgi:hypothetical protein